MRTIVIGAAAAALVLGAAAALVAGDDTGKPKTVADLTWLAGDWTSEDGSFDEHWLAPRGGAMLAVSRLVEDGRTPFCELTSVEDSADGPVFRILHYSTALVPWKSDVAGPMTMRTHSLAANEVVFEDAKRDWPRRIVYRRDGDRMTARLEGERDGKRADEEFVFKLAQR